MEIKEFIEETGKIEKYYGKELEKFQRDIWYREFAKLDVSRYRKIVMEVFRKCKFMPRLADLIEINQNLPYRTESYKQY